MKYKIIVDKQPMTNPTNEKKIYEIDIEELRCKGNVYDSLIITKDEDYVIRRLKLSEYHVLSILDEPVKQQVEDLDIELFKGKNYIYLEDMSGNKFNIEYLTDNDFNNQYATKVELGSAMKQTVKDIEFNVTQKLDEYSTTEEMKAAIKLTSETISNEVKKKIGEDELGTKIEQNYQHVQIAWNKIAELIQFINGELQILNQTKQRLMVLNKTGQHFFASNTEFGSVGVKTIDNKKYISFSVDGEYGQNIKNGMAWGITTKSDGAFFPVFFIENFRMAGQDSDDFYGQIVLNMCDLVLSGIGGGIIAGNVRIEADPLTNTLSFTNTETGDTLLNIIPNNDLSNNAINILNGAIRFFANAGGANTFKIGPIMLTDDGSFLMSSGSMQLGSINNKVSFSVYPNYSADIHGGLNVHGDIWANNFSSDRRIKKNIKNSTTNALNKIMRIKHRQFTKKEDNKHYDIGYIAQEMEKIDPNFVIKREKTEQAEERYYMNELPIIATISKAMQEQQKQIEKLTKRIEELEAK